MEPPDRRFDFFERKNCRGGEISRVLPVPVGPLGTFGDTSDAGTHTKRNVVITIEQANTRFFPEVLAWLAAEKERGETGFYCNRGVIEKSFSSGQGLCAFIDGRVVGFVVFNRHGDGGDIDIIEIDAPCRGLGVASQLLLAATKTLCELGANYVDVECTSPEGEALCRKHSFLDYVDPRNHRNEWENPLLRRYFTDWRPQPPNPWA